jgi:hypothetical protein
MYSDDAVLLRGLIDNFMSRIDVIMTIYGKYDPHLIGLLDKATYGERVNRISDIAIAYTNRALEMSKTGRLLNRINARLESCFQTVEEAVPILKKDGTPAMTKHKVPRVKTKKVEKTVNTAPVYWEKWSILRVGAQEWYDMQVDLIVQVQGHFAAFRNIALVEAFKAFQKDVQTGLGVSEKEWDDIEAEVDKMAAERAGQFPLASAVPEKSKVKLSEVSEADKKKLQEAGVRPEDLFSEG